MNGSAPSQPHLHGPSAASRIVYPLPPLLDGWQSLKIADDLMDKDRPRYGEVNLDFSALTFCKPSGVVFLANTIGKLARSGSRVKLILPRDARNSNRTSKTEALKYLDDSEFFKRFFGSTIFADSTVRQTTIPLQIIKQNQSHSWVENNFIPWISARTLLKASAFSEIKVSLKELFNNISDHSGEFEGFAFAQIYPMRRNFIISISDFGVGIPYNVKKIRSDLSDADCLLLASQEGFTTSTTGRNLGLGLDTLIRYAVEQNKGVVRVRSGQGLLLCTASEKGAKRSTYTTTRCFGTLIEFQFQIDRLRNVDDDGQGSTLEWT
jgi:hypothetical protein